MNTIKKYIKKKLKIIDKKTNKTDKYNYNLNENWQYKS